MQREKEIGLVPRTRYQFFALPFVLALSVFYLAVTLYSHQYQTGWKIFIEPLPPRITLPQGHFTGKFIDAELPVPVEAFLGIPYAQRPVGTLRFRHPLPVLKSNETFEATEFGTACPAAAAVLKPPSGVNEDEDCLTLNVFRPKSHRDGKKIPVAVYIHGGAFNRGTSQMHNTASMVAWSESPFLGITFNYRLGAFGFLASNISFAEGITNLGLHDQDLLLQWVHENVDLLGGDKNDVTLFGLSAGAHSIGHHIMNYTEGVKPLFQKAIIESGASTSRAVHPYNATIHEEQFSHFLSLTECHTAPHHQIFPCLRLLHQNAIRAASSAVFAKYDPSLRWAFQPVIDHGIIKERPVDAWQAGRYHQVPIITGHQTNEGSMYVPARTKTGKDFTKFFHTLLPQLSKKDLKTIDQLYPDPSTSKDQTYLDTRDLEKYGISPQFKRIEAAYAHYAYTCPVRQTAEFVSQEPDYPVWVYHWGLNKTVRNGANHGDNMYYETFQDSTTRLSERQKELSGQYHAYLTSFITKGNPNTLEGRYANRPDWPKYGGEGKNFDMTFGAGNDECAGGNSIGVISEVRKWDWVRETCQFWWDKSRLSQN